MWGRSARQRVECVRTFWEGVIVLRTPHFSTKHASEQLRKDFTSRVCCSSGRGQKEAPGAADHVAAYVPAREWKSKTKDRFKKGMMKAKPSSRRSDAGRGHNFVGKERDFAVLLEPSFYSRPTTVRPWQKFLTHHTPKVRHFREGKGVGKTGVVITLSTGRQCTAPGNSNTAKIELEVPAARQAPQRRDEWSSLSPPRRRQQHVFWNSRASANPEVSLALLLPLGPTQKNRTSALVVVGNLE
ncbi:hypothetical protein EDB86DRAFT_2825660 [Lactarius hatsudake]|nr:hypothetical protein EDB86DRAFT_2825660 [Lactarius hatsudake]